MMFPQKWYQNVQNLVSGFIAKFWLDVDVIFMVYNSTKYTMEKVFFFAITLKVLNVLMYSW